MPGLTSVLKNSQTSIIAIFATWHSIVVTDCIKEMHDSNESIFTDDFLDTRCLDQTINSVVFVLPFFTESGHNHN